MNIRQQLVRSLPPVLLQAARRVTRRPLRFTAVAEGWDAAVRLSSGYDGEEILCRVVSAARVVKSGEAVFERDGVLFKEREIPFQLAAPLLRHACKHGGRLDVVDFGGSLGSTYYQLRPFFPALQSLRWHVVEQRHFVAAGRAEFETDELKFHANVDELPQATAPRIALLSSVLQYLSSPHETIERLYEIDAETMIIDRTPFSDVEFDQVCIQQVPASIYKASYPCWILSKDFFDARCAAVGWREELRFSSAEGGHHVRGGASFRFEGRILEARR